LKISIEPAKSTPPPSNYTLEQGPHEYMTICNSGKVGIGNSSPNDLLDVERDVQIDGKLVNADGESGI
jgi:hypothetical protein